MKKLLITFATLLFVSCNNSEEIKAEREKHIKDSIDAIIPLTPEQIKLQDSILEVKNEQIKKDEIQHQKELKKKLLALDNELVIEFKNRWNNLKVEHAQFLTYLDALEGTYSQMEVLNSQNNNALPKLMALCKTFKQSQKHLNALTDYQKFGQLTDNNDLFIPCKIYLENNANDPSSIDVVDQKVQGRNKNGWIVFMRFRGKNAFGGLVLNEKQFVLNWVDVERVYTVVNATD